MLGAASASDGGAVARGERMDKSGALLERKSGNVGQNRSGIFADAPRPKLMFRQCRNIGARGNQMPVAAHQFINNGAFLARLRSQLRNVASGAHVGGGYAVVEQRGVGDVGFIRHENVDRLNQPRPFRRHAIHHANAQLKAGQRERGGTDAREFPTASHRLALDAIVRFHRVVPNHHGCAEP